MEFIGRTQDTLKRLNDVEKTLNNQYVKITDYITGPFVIVVTVPDDDAFPMVISPPDGFKTREEALEYINIHFANRKEPYLGCHFSIAPLRTPSSFIIFCSWEE